jgi:hypothetical protein
MEGLLVPVCIQDAYHHKRNPKGCLIKKKNAYFYRCYKLNIVNVFSQSAVMGNQKLKSKYG